MIMCCVRMCKSNRMDQVLYDYVVCLPIMKCMCVGTESGS